MTTAVSDLLAWATAGSAPTALLKFSAAVGALAFWHIHRRYLGILGANRHVPAERQAYDTLRNNLIKGNLPARLYARWLTRFLDWIDRFFGDAGMAGRTLFPHAFWLRTPAPLWTAPAFDRCLFLALIYPITTIFVIWTIFGHVGPVEQAFGLKPDLPGWQRGLVAAWGALPVFAWALIAAGGMIGVVSGAFAIVIVSTLAAVTLWIIYRRGRRAHKNLNSSNLFAALAGITIWYGVRNTIIVLGLFGGITAQRRSLAAYSRRCLRALLRET
jgi:hypothetical protein